ncbi:recombinase family protein [Rubeoparvulum massiliense]|uniref:recombinase family protein n=1 Tax=Rubeoparvulum massiliense TaxID=1631346 RepID=UPI00065E1774|nr:recombinase family protein [Rubeoparvulum massiliense]
MIGIYVRVSTEEQAKKGYSLDSQLLECKKIAAANKILEYIDDGYSGEFLERPALMKLREDVRDGLIAKIICYDPDRLSRKLMNQLIIDEEFRKHGVDVVYVNGDFENTPDGRMFYMMRGAIAEYEKAKINERMSRGRKQKAREGKVVKNYHIYGYDYDKALGQLIIREDEARVVQLIFNLFTKPNTVVRGINGIAKYLTEQGIPTKRGAVVWHRQVVRQILFNPVYKGEFIQNKWNTEGMLVNKYKINDDERIPMKLRPEEEWIVVDSPAIISEEQFEHAQQLLAESRRRWAKQGVRTYLLSGLVRCGTCHNTMTGRRYKNWDTHVLEYTDVKNTAGAKNVGCGNRIRVEEIDAIVWNYITDILNNLNNISEFESQHESSTYEELELERITTEIKKIQKGKKRLLSLFAMEKMDEEDIRKSLQELKEREEQLIARYQVLREKFGEEKEREVSKATLQQIVDFYFRKGEFTVEEKQEMLRTLVKEIIVYQDHSIEMLLF